MNKRIAAHKNRKGPSPEQETPTQAVGTGSSRAAEAAARVAARYAKAPTYSQMQAAEAQVAVRAAEIATQVAREAQVAAETVLAELHAASVETPSRGPAVIETFAPPAKKYGLDQARKAAVPGGPQPAPQPGSTPAPGLGNVEALLSVNHESTDASFVEEAADRRAYGIRWEPDLPGRAVEMRPAQPREKERFDLPPEDWWTPGEASANWRNEPIEVAGAQTLHANVIHFPRELVASRKIRPRLAEAAGVPAGDEQLSIFEVDPRAVATDAPARAAERPSTESSWRDAEWSGIELEAHPWEAGAAEVHAAPKVERPQLAPFGRRMMALVADAGLIAGAFVLTAFLTAINIRNLPTGKPLELAAAAVMLFTWLAYHAFFFAVAKSTPGMSYAGVRLSTFAGASPTRAQMRQRLGGMVLSLLPVGIGVVWALFDEDHLSWHDRISQTYLRKR